MLNISLQVTEYKKVVRQSWTILETVIDRLNSTFHKRLGEVDPLAESCFKGTQVKNNVMFTVVLLCVIAHNVHNFTAN